MTNIIKYLVKIDTDANGENETAAIKGIVDSGSIPRFGRYIIVPGPEFDRDKLTITKKENGEYEITANTKIKEVEEAYALMRTDVIAAMTECFDTPDMDSANANSQTWDIMKASPGDFVACELKVSIPLNGFEEGDSLDTEQKILDYSTLLVQRKKDFGIYRMERIQQFRNERANILAE